MVSGRRPGDPLSVWSGDSGPGQTKMICPPDGTGKRVRAERPSFRYSSSKCGADPCESEGIAGWANSGLAKSKYSIVRHSRKQHAAVTPGCLAATSEAVYGEITGLQKANSFVPLTVTARSRTPALSCRRSVKSKNTSLRGPYIQLNRTLVTT